MCNQISNTNAATEAIQSTDLLACPFCGSDATFEEIDQDGYVWWSVGCRDENCYGWQSMKSWARKTDAAKGWNQRKETWQAQKDRVLLESIVTTLNNAGVRIEGREVGRHNILQGVRKHLPAEKTDRSEITSVVRQCMADTPTDHPDYAKIQGKLNS